MDYYTNQNNRRSPQLDPCLIHAGLGRADNGGMYQARTPRREYDAAKHDAEKEAYRARKRVIRERLLKRLAKLDQEIESGEPLAYGWSGKAIIESAEQKRILRPLHPVARLLNTAIEGINHLWDLWLEAQANGEPTPSVIGYLCEQIHVGLHEASAALADDAGAGRAGPSPVCSGCVPQAVTPERLNHASPSL